MLVKKVCKTCSLEKELDKFPKTNKGYFRGSCKSCYHIQIAKAPSRVLHNQYRKKHYSNNREAIIKQATRRKKVRYQTDPYYKLKKQMRNRLKLALKNNWKSGQTIELLGCSISELKYYIESQFQPGMTWNNRKDWHIDHIKPLCTFNLNNPDQVKIACHHSNLRPLWAEENMRRSRNANVYRDNK